MPNSWDGKTERRVNMTDHDTLIELVQIIKNQTDNAKNIATNLILHEARDQTNFDSIKKDILGLQKIVWTATGIIVAIDALPKIVALIHVVK